MRILVYGGAGILLLLSGLVLSISLNVGYLGVALMGFILIFCAKICKVTCLMKIKKIPEISETIFTTLVVSHSARSLLES